MFPFFKETIAVRSVVSSFVLMKATGPRALQSTVTYTGEKFTFLFLQETSAVHGVVSSLALMKDTMSVKYIAVRSVVSSFVSNEVTDVHAVMWSEYLTTRVIRMFGTVC